MGMDCEFKIGQKVVYWAAEDPKERVIGVVSDIAFGQDLCTYEEDTGHDYDEEDDACGYEHDNWYVKVKLANGEETDWTDEYYFREVE